MADDRSDAGPTPTTTSGAGGMPPSPPSGAAGSSGGGMTSNPPSSLSCESPSAPVAPMALLTRAQYDATVSDLFGKELTPSTAFPPENQVDGFNNNVAAHQASPLLVEKYLQAAESLAASAVAEGMDRVAPCPEGKDVFNCGAAFVREFGQRAFRRPLNSIEQQLFYGLFERGHTAAGYAFGVELVLQAMLQSPQFLYRMDALTAPATPETGAVVIGDYELASRLSYFLTGSMPDQELLSVAAQGALVKDDQLAAQAQRLLKTPRARQMVREFHHQWLKLDSLPNLSRVTSLGGETVAVGADLLGSIDRFVDHVYWDVGKASELFSSKKVFLSPALAALFGESAPATDFAAVELPDRAGLLTQPALLALLAHTEQTAPVLRGVFVRQRLLCLEVPAPPPDVNTTPPDPDPNATTRERFRQHTENVKCSGCHQLIDGIGFGFEAYDQLGRFRTLENGLDVDTSGNVIGTGEPAIEGPFDGVSELSARLASSPRVRECLATTWYRYAMGRTLTENDSCSLDQVRTAFNDSGGDLQGLFVAVALSDGFRFRAPVPGDMP